MICPHCKKSLKWFISDAVKKRILSLGKQLHSTREIERILLTEGHRVSYVTVSRVLKEERGK